VAATLFKVASLLEGLVGDSADALPIEVEGTEPDRSFAEGENVGGDGGKLVSVYRCIYRGYKITLITR
jgi:hypothetical protein